MQDGGYRVFISIEEYRRLKNEEPPEVAACMHPAWARAGVPYAHQRCVECGAVYKSVLWYVSQYGGENDN